MVLLVVDTQKGIVDERLYAFEKFVINAIFALTSDENYSVASNRSILKRVK